MDIAKRTGPKPTTHFGLPHQQLDQQPTDRKLRKELARRLFELPGVAESPSLISVPGARGAFLVGPPEPAGPGSAFFVASEFAHLHPGVDQSLHLHLPEAVAEQAITAGFAEMHPLAVRGQVAPTRVMLFAPRDEDELETVWSLVETSYDYAVGQDR
jgi:hypothetical protein